MVFLVAGMTSFKAHDKIEFLSLIKMKSYNFFWVESICRKIMINIFFKGVNIFNICFP